MTQSPPVTEATTQMSDDEIISSIGAYEYGWHDNDDYSKDVPLGINESVVRFISDVKDEPQWMRERRLKALELFERKPMPTWGPDLSGVDFDAFKYYVRPTDRQVNDWEDLPEEIRDTYDRLGIPEAEKNRLVSGVAGDNKFSALNTAAWSGGSFVYVPPGVHVNIPLQAYFRINTQAMGQFERTLIIADEGSYVHYVEGCTAPIYDENSLHSGVIEIFVKKDARVRYTTVQNWSTNVLNLVTQRAMVDEGGTMEWVDGNMGAAITMKYPACFLMGEHARGETLSIGFAGPGQQQDTGAKMVHMAPHTSSSIVSKSVSRGGGRTSYLGLVQINARARHSKSNVLCDALLVDKVSRTDTYPYVDVRTDDVEMGHEATVSKVSADQLFYLMSRGLDENEAMATIVRGFVEPIAKELPMEYALELNRLIELQMEGSVG